MEISKLVSFSLTLVLVVGLVQSQGFTYSDKDMASDEAKAQLYDRWRTHYQVPADKKKNLDVFKTNLDYVDQNNKANKPYKLGLNKYADLTNEDFVKTRTGLLSRHHQVKISEKPGGAPASGPPPPTVDWRKENAVTPAKDQGQCACSWAFATVGAVESANQIATKQLVPLSEQVFLDCDTHTLNAGCLGGILVMAYDFIKKNGGLPKEADYPYIGEMANDCNQEKAKSPGVSIKSYRSVNTEDENLLMKAIAKNPVSAAIDAKSLDIQLYASGVFTGNCGKAINHGVLVVGYGEEGGTKFYTIKSSWGAEWGEEGFMRLERQIADKAGKCGIALEAVYPTIAAAADGGPKTDL